ncbi:MAG: glycosyltransferase [Cyanobacteria bacterium J06558_2]
MKDTDLKQTVLIMTGMHRSGTSLTASLLQSAGVNIGERLMEPTAANPRGYFEDWDFVELHCSILSSQGIDNSGWSKEKKIEVQPQYLATAQKLISARENQLIWGWKDPRTTLFLDFWLQLIPDAKFVFVYRSPWEVLDSLFRRGEQIFRTNPNFALEQWQTYNQALLDFYHQHPESCLLFHIESVIDNAAGVIDLVKQKFQLELQSPETLYEPALFSAAEHGDYRRGLINKFFPSAIDLYAQLESQADFSCPKLQEPYSLEREVAVDCTPWILQDWIDLRLTKAENQQNQTTIAEVTQVQQQLIGERSQLQQQLQSTAGELEQTQQQLQSTAGELEQTQQQLQSTAGERSQLQKQLQSTAGERSQLQKQLQSTTRKLAQTQQQLLSTTGELDQAELQQLTAAFEQSQTELRKTQVELGQFKLLVTAMESSKFWKLRRWWLGVKQKYGRGTMDALYQNYLFSQNQVSVIEPKIAPPKIAQTAPKIPASNNPQYQKWLEKHYPRKSDLKRLGEATKQLPLQPLISIIVPVYNPDESFLRQAIESVREQVYSNWELCLADDCSPKPHVRNVLEEYAQKDSRIKVTFRQKNGHISQASNSALSLATGEYIALLDHDDLLAPHALARVVACMNQHPDADFIYSDEDKINEQNIHQDPFFKPDWCPDSFLSRMYTCHLGVYRRSLITAVGNFRVGFEGSQDYDLVLRVTEKTTKIHHIPDILYHWRIHQQSTAASADAKPYAFNAAQKALSEAIHRRGESGRVINHSQFPGIYTVRYEIREPKLVSIIIPTKDLADTLNACLKSIFAQTTYPNYEVIVIDNGSTEAKTKECFASWQEQQPERFKCYGYDIPFNYSKINNYAVEQAQGDYLLFLNNDTEVITADWLEAMVEQAQRPAIGAVGSLLLYPDDTIQHAGVVTGLGGVAGHGHQHLPGSHPGYHAQVVSINNYSAVTAACLMCRRSAFEEVGGFEEDLAVTFNDVDFCLKLVRQGYRNIYLPHVKLYHYESKSRGYDNTPVKQARFNQEVNYMKHKWSHLCDRDPCYNVNLTKSHGDYRLSV